MGTSGPLYAATMLYVHMCVSSVGFSSLTRLALPCVSWRVWPVGYVGGSLAVTLHAAVDMLLCSIRCKAHGPLVKITPLRLNWGVCPVLTPLEKTFIVDNESLIPAVFNCTLVSEWEVGSHWGQAIWTRTSTLLPPLSPLSSLLPPLPPPSPSCPPFSLFLPSFLSLPPLLPLPVE